MKTIIRPGRPIYENRLKYGRFRCQACGCEFTADAGDIEYTDLYACGDIVERNPFSHCPNCGEAALFENGEWEKVRRTESGYVHLTAEMIEEANKELLFRIDNIFETAWGGSGKDDGEKRNNYTL